MSTQYALVLNSGSSSIKFQVLDPNAAATDEPLVSGLVEKIGEPTGLVRVKINGEKQEDTSAVASHAVGLKRAFLMMSEKNVGPQDLDLIAVGHRVVHGGEEFAAPQLVEGDVIERLKKLIPLAPLHNPANIEGIETAQELLPNVPHVAVFDTAFFANMPESAANYAINREVAKE